MDQLCHVLSECATSITRMGSSLWMKLNLEREFLVSHEY